MEDCLETIFIMSKKRYARIGEKINIHGEAICIRHETPGGSLSSSEFLQVFSLID